MSNQLHAQQNGEWNGKKCAVVLTYDDALNVHLDNVVPSLDSFNIKGTFYIIGEAPALSERIADWRMAAQNGHELGNHTLTHPCSGGAGRSWITEENDLRGFSVHRAVNEIKITNTLLEAIDGKKERSFAYPCGDKMTDTVRYYDLVKDEFTGARGVSSGLQKVDEVDLTDIRATFITNQSGANMIKMVDEARQSGTLLVFLFHGVGGEHNINVSLDNHSQLVQYMAQHEADIWNTSLTEVAKFIKSQQAEK